MDAAARRTLRPRDGALVFACLGLAVLATASGVDRMSRVTPRIAALVPPGWRAMAWRGLAAAAIEQNRPGAAIAAATHAMRRDPVDPEAAALLATSRFIAGDEAGAARAFRVAGRMGWRAPTVQIYLLAAAEAAGDRAVAAERLDALLRQQPRFAAADQILARFESSAGGRRALALRLAERPGWLGSYLAPDGALTLADWRRRALVASEPTLAAKLTCADVAPLVQALLARGGAREARRLWTGRCGGAGATVADPGFERSALDSASPFAWSFPGSGDLSQQFVERAGFAGRALTLASTAPRRLVAARQAVELAPGRYLLRWRAEDADPPRLRVTVGCGQEPAGAPPPRRIAANRYAADVTVPPDGCPMPWLTVAVLPGPGPLAIDDITIRRLGERAARGP